MPKPRSIVAVIIACLAAGVLMPARPAGAGWIYTEGEAPVRAAIVEAVRARMGSAVDVTIGSLQIRQAPGVTLIGPVAAVPDAGARTGGFIRFALYAVTKPAGRRVGTADAEIFVTAEQVTARRAIPRGQTIGAADVETAIDDLGRVPLKSVPGARQTIGSTALRAIVPGVRITAAMIAAPALVKSGDEVQTIARVGSLEARGTAIATERGSLGKEIRLVNASSRRNLRGRVVGQREVEVIYEH